MKKDEYWMNKYLEEKAQQEFNERMSAGCVLMLVIAITVGAIILSLF